MKLDIENKSNDIVHRAGLKIMPKQHRRLDNVTPVQYHELRACSKLAVKIVDDKDRDERLQCPYCTATFKNKSGMSGHIQAKHPDKFREEEEIDA